MVKKLFDFSKTKSKMSHKTIKNYVSTYNTNAICIFTTVKPAEFKSDALFLKHPVVQSGVVLERPSEWSSEGCIKGY